MAALNLVQPQTGQAYQEMGNALSMSAPGPSSSLPSIDGTGERMEKQDVESMRITSLGAYIQRKWEEFKSHDDTIRHQDRCNDSLRTYKGQYSPQQLQKISSQFGGSTVFSHITSTKCRGATAILRDIFLGNERPWGLQPTKAPVMPTDVTQQIQELVKGEVQALVDKGQEVPVAMIQDRILELMAEAQDVSTKKAFEEAKLAEKKLEDILADGGFYEALADFLVDLPIFPFACIKGPVVKQVQDNKWVTQEDGRKVMERGTKTKMFWYRVSPFDLYISPGASCIEDASTIEFSKVSRAELNALIGLPGYREEAIRKVLREYTTGFVVARQDDSERAWQESREDPHLNRAELLDTLEFQGAVHGQMLRDYGYTEDQVPDPDRDYFINAWVIGQHVIKVQISPDPNQRPNYYVTSFERVPGSVRGLGITDILEDIQRMANGTLRALSNNMAMASGPQVAVNEDRLASSSDADNIYPWKRWRFHDPLSPTSNNAPAVEFFQPQSNANELLAVYQSLTNISDENSSIPRYLTGNERVGGAGRTASGLSMLMNASSKMMNVVASNIDRQVISPVLKNLYDRLMLTGADVGLHGDEDIVVRGVEISRLRDLERSRQLEFLSITANPVDLAITGKRGRAAVLRRISEGMGIPDYEVVPDDKTLVQQEMQEQQEREAMIARGEQPDQQVSMGTAPGVNPESGGGG